MRIRGIGAGLAFFCCIVFGDQVSLSGTVVSQNGTLVAGAKLRLHNFSHLKATTDGSGEFVLQGNTITPITLTNGIASRSIRVRIQGMNLMINGLQGGAITVDILTSSGRKVGGAHMQAFSSRELTIPLARQNIAAGVYFINIKTARVHEVFTMVVADKRQLQQSCIVNKTTHHFVAQVCGSALNRALDTLIITAAGRKHAIMAVLSYTQSAIKCTLAVSSAWQPSGALEHNSGMVKIKANSYNFEMGQPDPDIWGPGTSTREQPMHTVSFTKDFWMDTTLVTQKDYDTLMKTTYTGYVSPPWDDTYGRGDTMPTYSVMWGDAALYCNARSKRDGFDTVYRYDSIIGDPGYMSELFNLTIDLSKNGYHLPTEAQWEYACRAGTSTDFYWGKNFENYPVNASDTAEIGNYAVWTVNSWNIVTGDEWGVYRVASKKPNAYGLYDMSGNLFEWCNDWDKDNSYGWDDVVDPQGPASGDGRVVRGGSWGNEASYLRSANRYFFAPDYLYYFLGFRVVRQVQ